MEDQTPGNQRNRNILIGIIVAAGTFLAGILVKRWRSRAIHGATSRKEKRILRKIKGLSDEEAEKLWIEGQDNSLHFKPSRSRKQIWRDNILSIFNLSLVGLALVQLLFAKPIDALMSLGVLAFNIGINIFQEYFARLRMKDILMKTRSRVTVIRDGKSRSLDGNDIVVGDMVAFGPGDELLADGKIIYQNDLIVDESMLSEGNRRSRKFKGDRVYAGTFCVSGRAVYQVEKIGLDRRISSLIVESQEAEERLTPIEKIINRVLRILLIVVAIFTLFFVHRYLNIDLPIPEDLFNEVAGIIFSLAPAGLFFMITVTYAASTVDIANVGALVRRARSVETLAQVNTICFSQEGVLTQIQVEMTISTNEGGAQEMLGENRVQQILGDYVRSSMLDNQLTRAIASIYEGSPRNSLDEAPYLSIYGWNAITFDDPDLTGVYVLGVPAIIEPYLNKGILKEIPAGDEQEGQVRKVFTRLGGFLRRSNGNRSDNGEPNQNGSETKDIDNLVSSSSEGEIPSNQPEDSPTKSSIFRRIINRVNPAARKEGDLSEIEDGQEIPSDPPIELLFAYNPEPQPLFNNKGHPQFPKQLIPLCQISFIEQVHPESVNMIKKFIQQGIGVKIFSAEKASQTLGVLKNAGLSDSLKMIEGTELAALGKDDFSRAATNHDIFLHLNPEQKGNIVADLRSKGQYVAVVGNSVNDVPALVQANLAVSYQTSSQATQSVADILLLENSPQVLVGVLEKGQRIVNGLLDILKIYITQVFYLAIMISAIQILRYGFPIRGIHLTVITTVSITIPSLGLTIWAKPGVLYEKSVQKSLMFFITPAAITMGLTGAVVFYYFRTTTGQADYAHLAVTYYLVFTGLLVLLFLRPPFHFLAGGAPLDRDRRIFLMVAILAVLFFITVALTVAIPFLADLLMLEWLHNLQDYLIISAVVILWTIAVQSTWRIWRLAWIDQELLDNLNENGEVPSPLLEVASTVQPVDPEV